MTREHADFYLGTGPDARWLGSVAEFGGPDQVSTLEAQAGHCESAGVLSALDPDTYEAAVAALLDHQRATEVGLVAVPATGDQVGWPWLASSSARWYAYAFTDRHVCASLHGGPWFILDLDLLDFGIQSGTGPDAELPTVGDTTPKTATFTWNGIRGLPIPITQTLPPVPQTYLAHRGEVALAVAGAAEAVLGRRWPLADLNRAAIHKVPLTLLAPGPAPNLSVLPEDAPTATPRATTPERGHELLASAASVAAQAVTAHCTHQPYRWSAR